MKKFIIILSLFALVGAGCVKSSPTAETENSTFGLSHFGRLTSERIGSDIQGGWVRPHPGPFWWDEIERSPGQYDWSRADREVRRWNKADQAILATLWPFSQWDQTKCHKEDPKVKNPFGTGEVWLSSVCNVDSYQRFVSALVERYDGDGVEDMPGLTHPITHWEIGNEPDLQSRDISFFQGDDFAFYELFSLARQAALEANRNAQIVMAGQSGMTPNGSGFFRAFLTQTRGEIDILNIHSIGASDTFFAGEYRGFVNGLGYEKTPFWITEALVGTPDNNWDEDTAARMTFIGYASAFAHGAQRVFNVGAHDPTGGPGKKSEQVFELMAQTVGFFDSAQWAGDSAVVFEINDEIVFAMWNGSSVPGDYMDETVEVLRYDGTRSNGKARDVVADVPIFVFVD